MEYPIIFLQKLFNHNHRTTHVKIELLNWIENVSKEIQGIITSGSYSEDGNSSARRAITISFASEDENKQSLVHLIQASKKIRVSIGLENKIKGYMDINDDIIWFDLGIFVPNSVQLTHDIGSSNITITASDKMSLLNNTLGGCFNVPTSFVEKTDDGQLLSMKWREIFLMTASTFGHENPGKVLVDSVPDYIPITAQVKSLYGLKEKIIHEKAPKEKEGERLIIDAYLPDKTKEQCYELAEFSKSDKVYILKKFGPADPVVASDNTSQEEYILDAGVPLTNVFDDVVTQLNKTHQYYYDEKGNLRLEPLPEYYELKQDREDYKINDNTYLANYSRLPVSWNMEEDTTIINYSNVQTFENIKNDFTLIGKGGKSLEIAIDHKPEPVDIIKWFKNASDDYAGLVEDPVLDYNNKDIKESDKRRNICFPSKNEEGEVIWKTRFPVKIDDKGNPLKYVEFELEGLPWQILHGLRSWHLRNLQGTKHLNMDWFQLSELGKEYSSGMNNYRWGYECEQLIYQVTVDKNDNWLGDRGVFDLYGWSQKNGRYWKTGYSVATEGEEDTSTDIVDYKKPNFDEKGDSSTWSFWFDLIDDSGYFHDYGINQIGRRSYVETVETATTIFKEPAKDIIVIQKSELDKISDKEYVLNSIKKQNKGYYIIQDNWKKYTAPEDYTQILEDGNIAEPPEMSVVENNRQGKEGFFTSPIDKKAYFVGGGYNGSDPITEEIPEDEEVSEESKEKTGIILFEQIEGAEDPVYYHSRLKKDFSIPANPNVAYKYTSYDGSTMIKKGNEVAYPQEYPFTVVDDESKEEKARAELEKKSPCFMIFTEKTPTDHLTNKHPHFLIVRQNFDTKNWEFWGEDCKWRRYFFKENDTIIATYKDSMFTFLFNISDVQTRNLFSVSGLLDLFSIVQPLVCQKTNTNDQVNITTLTNYHLKTNTLVQISDEKTGIAGLFKIINISTDFKTEQMTLTCIKVQNYF